VPVVHTLPAWAVVRGCLREIGRLKADVAREGWTAELAGRALTVFRVAGALALERPLTQTVVDRHVPGREGQLVLRKGILRPRRALVSASTTAEAITRQLTDSDGRGPNLRTRTMLEEIRDALLVFTVARYGRNGHVDTTALDRALDNGSIALRRLRLARLWPMRTSGVLTKSVVRVGGVEWSR